MALQGCASGDQRNALAAVARHLRCSRRPRPTQRIDRVRQTRSEARAPAHSTAGEALVQRVDGGPLFAAAEAENELEAPGHSVPVCPAATVVSARQVQACIPEIIARI